MASIQKWKNGRYRDHGRKSQSQVFDYIADARAHLELVEADLESGTYLTKAERSMIVTDYVNGYYLPAQRWRPTTREQFDSHWCRHIEPRWGDVRLASIRLSNVQGWVNELAEGDGKQQAALAPARVTTPSTRGMVTTSSMPAAATTGSAPPTATTTSQLELGMMC